jgi:sugar lactone lactonase YvrE
LTLFALFALASLAAGSSPAAPSNEFVTQLGEARRLFAEGAFREAYDRFERIDRENDGHPSATWYLARIAAARGDLEQAVQRLEQYAGMGLAVVPARDSLFAPLAEDKRYLAATLLLARNAAPLRNATVLHPLDDPNLLPEDLAHDPRTRTLYVSSIHRRKVLAIDSTGAVRDFVPPGQNGIWGVYGLALDVRGDLLWGSIAAGPPCGGCEAADSGRTALVAWEIGTGAERRRVELPRDGTKRVLGDIALGEDGTVYATESIGGALYALRPEADALDTVAAPGTFGSPQSPVVLPGGKRLLVADYPRGILTFDLETRTAGLLRKPRSLAATGIDGLSLVRRPDGLGLLAVQNGTLPSRLLWLSLDAGAEHVTGWKVLEQGSPALGEPNHAMVVGDEAWLIGNSGWERVDEHGNLPPAAGAAPPAVLRVRLPVR